MRHHRDTHWLPPAHAACWAPDLCFGSTTGRRPTAAAAWCRPACLPARQKQPWRQRQLDPKRADGCHARMECTVIRSSSTVPAPGSRAPSAAPTAAKMISAPHSAPSSLDMARVLVGALSVSRFCGVQACGSDPECSELTCNDVLRARRATGLMGGAQRACHRLPTRALLGLFRSVSTYVQCHTAGSFGPGAC